MPNKSSHIEFANRCQVSMDRLRTCEDDDHSEWITTIAFYKALHVVEAVFSHFGDSHERNHEKRERLLKSDRKYQNIYKHYRPLWAASTVARYLAGPGKGSYNSFSSYLPPEEVEPMIIRHYLRQIEKSCLAFLGDSSGLNRCESTE